MANVLLAGYFGSGNLGDDAILAGFCNNLGPGFDITVMSGAPEETYRHFGFRAIPRKDSKAFDEALSKADALIFPGGSIFQDVTSVRSVGYYSQIVRKAKKARKRVYLLAQGVGPLNRFLGKRMAASAFEMADVVTVRDPGSASALRAMGIKGDIKVTADPAFLLSPGAETDSAGFSVGNMTTVGIAPRPYAKDKKAVQKVFGDLAKLLFQNNFLPVLLEMDRNEDGQLIVDISKAQGGKIPDIRRLQLPQQMQRRMSRMHAVVGMRLHAGILAASVGVPPFMVSYDPKVAAFSKMMELPHATMEGLTGQRLFELFMSFQRDRERMLKIVEAKRNEMADLARQNISIVRESLAPSGRA